MTADLDAATMTLGIDSDEDVEGWYTALFFEAWGIEGGRRRKVVNGDRER